MPIKTKLARLFMPLTVLSFLLSLGFGVGTAAAQGPACVWQTTYTVSWGKGQACVSPIFVSGDKLRNIQVMVDDTLTDGYCVHAEGHWSTGAWEVLGPGESCGPAYTTPVIVYVNNLTEIRLVRGPAHNPPNGIGVNYQTLWYNPAPGL